MSPGAPGAAAAVEAVMREDWGRLLAVLIGDLRDFQLSEDCLAEAFARALEHWARGVPDNPQGWLLQTARRRAIDQIRRRASWRGKLTDLAYLIELDAGDRPEPKDIPDDRLRLIFTACHPALDEKTRVALTLRTLCGLTTAEIARAFLDKEATMGQRLARARTKIARAGIPYTEPAPQDWDGRLHSVLTVIYLIFNEGHAASAGPALLRRDLGEEAIRLARAVNNLRPDIPESMGLLALLLLTRARSPARLDGQGRFVPLDRQDRSLWDKAIAAEGLRLLENALRRGRPGPFQLQAAISAVHTESAHAEETDWTEIVLIYDRLVEMSDNPVVRLNRAVALSFAQGPREGLAALPEGLDAYQSYHAARADMQRRAGQADFAAESYGRALALTRTVQEREFLQEQLDQVAKKKRPSKSSAQVQQGG